MSDFTRRAFFKTGSAPVLPLASLAVNAATTSPPAKLKPPTDPLSLRWLDDQAPALSLGQTKIYGLHASKGRHWLPFSVRPYFYAGAESVRVRHTFIFDGDEHKDFLRGIGLRLKVPLRDPPHDRHVRFAGKDGGLWAEGVRNLTGLRRDPGAAVRAAQLAGLACPPLAEFGAQVRQHLERIPAWGDYTLSQLAADAFQIRKRTKAGHGWIPAAWGHRAPGTGYIGGATVGVGLGRDSEPGLDRQALARMKRLITPLMLCAGLLCGAAVQAADTYKIIFGGPPEDVSRARESYSREHGYGFEPGAELMESPQGLGSSGKPFFFSADLPEGNYRVSLDFGGPAASASTVRAELRRLMLEDAANPTGGVRSFTVNVRTPMIPASDGIKAGRVQLKAPRETIEEAWAWDAKLTLEFSGNTTGLRSISITPVKVPTLFLLGDSTVADQSQEPYASWGQMLPRFFKPGVAVANHAESGETLRDSLARRRLDKIASALQAGDTVLLQFGHNDQKQIKAGSGDTASYSAELKQHVLAVRARGGVAVIVSPMERRGFDAQGQVLPSLLAYADAAARVATELDAPFIDLNAQSKVFYAALGPERSKLAFAQPEPGKVDNTHHNNYGSYQLARLIVQGLRQAGLAVAREIADDFAVLDPARPDAPENFQLAASPKVTHQRPLGD
ncbi:rhamnogalacturonan acetylesterase [Roseateles oligotrophus]|uniref:Rhamnogalacturonan acetylesterase n=1 Tax=Roseateles oligotrophus TaxID=1769250 RepID=A0ABT2YAA8_9BURK|nr:rhamnogalacturonan acetylesterase [Roseateles oligotrophus]MCV2367231.1 rhamnogalacturonan acetylesterase [Roseateles oligotrophus]